MVHIFKNVGKWSTAKNYCPVSVLSVFNKVFQNLQIKLADLLTGVSGRIAIKLLTGLGLLELQHLIYPRLLGRVWHAVILHKLNSYGISGQIFGLISFFLDNMGLWVALDGKSSKKYPVNAGVPRGSFVILHFSYVLSSFE